jgi:hypothetical protein
MSLVRNFLRNFSRNFVWNHPFIRGLLIGENTVYAYQISMIHEACMCFWPQIFGCQYTVPQVSSTWQNIVPAIEIKVTPPKSTVNFPWNVRSRLSYTLAHLLGRNMQYSRKPIVVQPLAGEGL